MTLNKKVSIVIVTAGVKDYLNSCLDSIKKQSCLLLEIIVIDNSFDQDFRQRIIQHYPQVKLYSSSGKSNYCQALNSGIGMSRGDFILCLNDDVTLDERFIEKALTGFSVDEKIGMVSGRILRQDKATIDSTGLFLTPWRSAKERAYGEPDRGQFQDNGYIFGVNGAVAFYRKAMLEAVKLGADYFDTDYHFFYEDLDLAWRAQLLGWKGYYVPAAVAYHVRGGSARKGRGIGKPYARRYLDTGLQFDLLKNRYLTIIKNEQFWDFLLHLPLILSYDILTLIYVLFFRPILIIKLFLISGYLGRAFNKRKIIKLIRTEYIKK